MWRRTMLRLTGPRRALLADKLPDTGNLAMAAFVFGQVLGDGYSVAFALSGFCLWALFLVLAVLLEGSGT